jgi:hypothetical protein
MCTVLLPPGVHPIAVKYIISYIIPYHIMYQIAATGLYTVERLSYGNKVWECGLDALAQDRNQWRDLIKSIKKLFVPWKTRHFFVRRMTIGFSSTLLQQQSRCTARGSRRGAAEDSVLTGQYALSKGALTTSKPLLGPPSFPLNRHWVSYPGCKAAGTWSKPLTSYCGCYKWVELLAGVKLDYQSLRNVWQ